MTEYTYKDVIIDPEDPRVEIGKEYYFAYTPASALYQARYGCECTKGVLKMVCKDGDAPFVETSDEGFACLIRKKEPEKKYVPFDLSCEEDRAKLRGTWIRRKANNSVENQIIGLGIPGQVVFLNGVTGIDAKLLLEEYEFNDGTPCGKLVEVEDASK